MKKELNISAIEEGTVIDHIPSDATFKVADILDLKNTKGIISVAANLSSKIMGKKGIIKIEGKYLTQEEADKIAIIAPEATVNMIKDYEVTKKSKVSLPKTLNRIIKCSNPICITNKEKENTLFYVLGKFPLKVKCHYCERQMGRDDIVIV